jgi:hypothetical protein
MFFENFRGAITDTVTGLIGPEDIDIYQVDSANLSSWTSGNEYPILAISDSRSGSCGAITPGVLRSATDLREFDLFFSLVTTSYAKLANGETVPFCQILGTPNTIHKWTYRKSSPSRPRSGRSPRHSRRP